MRRFLIPLLALPLALSNYDSCHAETPAKPPSKTARVFIDSKAKAILERAAKLYGSKLRWSGKVALSTEDSKKVSIAFERPKKVAIEQKGEGEYRLIVTDGQREAEYSNGAAGESIGDTMLSRSIEEILVTSSSTSAPDTGIVPVLARLLNGKTGLSGREYEEKTHGATSVTVKQLSDTIWKGQKCQRVATDIRFSPAYDLDLTQYHEELWLSPDGKLLKVIGFKLIKADNGVPADKWNDEMLAQNFAPKFGPKTFVFSPPQTKK